MNYMKKLIKWLGLSLLAVFMLAACGNDDEGKKTEGTNDGDKVAETGKVESRYILHNYRRYGKRNRR